MRRVSGHSQQVSFSPLMAQAIRTDTVNAACSDDDDSAPTVLLLGGLGMVGLHVLEYLIEFRLARFIRVVDKRLPSMCHLSEERAALLERDDVEYVQADLSLPPHVRRAFRPQPEHMDGGAAFQVILNLAAETAYGLLEACYERNTLRARQHCAREAMTLGCERYIEVSTAEVFNGHSHASLAAFPAEDDAVQPEKACTVLGRYHAEAEKYLQEACDQLPWSVVRLPIVYGLGDKRGLMPRVACAAVYVFNEQPMECLWGPSLRQHTVHGQDAAAGIWHVVCAGNPHECYHVVDDHDSTQGTLNDVLMDLLPGLRVKYANKALEMMTQRLSPEAFAEQVNGDHLEIWDELLRYAHISLSPLSPYLYAEQLSHHHIALAGKKLKALGFTCSCPHVTADLVKDVVDYWTAQGAFPTMSVLTSN